MEGLNEKVIIIAGGATGIGAATARKLAGNGAKVVIGDFNEKGAVATASSITEAGGTASAFFFDMTDVQSIKNLIAYTLDTHGRIDGLHNNAADFKVMPNDTNIVGISKATWDRTLQVDLTGYFLTMQEVIPHMLKQESGSIVNTTSAAAYHGMSNLPAYSAAKAGVVALTRHVAVTYGRQGLRCNNVAPGTVPTESAMAAAGPTMAALGEEATKAMMDEMKFLLHSPRMGKPEDIAAAVAFLMSEEGSWINGQTFHVDGGWVIK